MNTTTKDYIGTLEEHTCGKCGIVFAAPQSFWEERNRDHSVSWYCPNGHQRVFSGPTEEQRLKSELRLKEQSLAAWRQDYAELSERERVERKAHAATKGNLTKMRNRIAAGVCPYCHRNFVALGKHIRGQHPEETNHV